MSRPRRKTAGDWAAIVLFFASVSITLSLSVSFPHRLAEDTVATVNGYAIRQADIDYRLVQLFGPSHDGRRTAEQRHTALNYLIDEELLIQFGERSRVLEKDRALRNAILQAAVVRAIEVDKPLGVQHRQLSSLVRGELELSDVWVSPRYQKTIQLSRYSGLADSGRQAAENRSAR